MGDDLAAAADKLERILYRLQFDLRSGRRDFARHP